MFENSLQTIFRLIVQQQRTKCNIKVVGSNVGQYSRSESDNITFILIRKCIIL